MLVELSVVVQRYHAVMEVVCGGIPVLLRSPNAMGYPARRCTPGWVATGTKACRG
jgi:hypothetical protein